VFSVKPDQVELQPDQVPPHENRTYRARPGLGFLKPARTQQHLRHTSMLWHTCATSDTVEVRFLTRLLPPKRWDVTPILLFWS